MAAPRTAFSQGRFYGAPTVERQLPSVRLAHLEATKRAEHVDEHSHDDAHFVLATHGRYITTAAGPETEGPVLVYNPPGVVHRDRFVDGGGCFLAVSFGPADWRALADAGRGAAIDALRDALRGSDPALRGTAATGLGTLGAKEAVPDLFVVLPKEVPQAAGAIGILCRGDECKRFVGLLGKLPFDVMESGFLPLLLRTDADASDAAKLQLIEQLRRMATKKSSELLATALASYPTNGNQKIRAAIDGALHGHPVPSSEP